MANNKLTVEIAGKESVSPAAKKVGNSLDSLEKNAKNTSTSLKNLGIESAAIVTALVVISKVMKQCEEAFFKQDQAVKLLESSLRSTGQYTEETSQELQGFASKLQEITTIGDEASLELMQFAISAGSTAEEAKKATQQAIGMSRAFGVDLKTAMRAVTLANEGNYTQLARYIPSIRSATTEAEKAAVAETTLANAFQLAKDEALTAAGVQQQLKNAIGDTKEIFGQAVAEGLTPFRQKLLEITQGVNEYLTELNNLKSAGTAKEAGNATYEQRILLLQQELDAEKAIAAEAANNPWLSSKAKARVKENSDERISALVAALRGISLQIEAEAALTEEQRKAAEEAAKQEERKKKAAEENQKHLDKLAEYYAKTKQGMIEALESEIAYFESFEEKGSRTLTVLEDLYDQLEAIKGVTEETTVALNDMYDAEIAAINATDAYYNNPITLQGSYSGEEEDDEASISLGGELGTILQAFQDGGDIWIALINIILSSLTQFEQFNSVLNIISTLISSLSQTIILPLFQILSPVIALLQSIVQLVGVVLYPWLEILVGVMSCITPILELISIGLIGLLSPLIALGGVIEWAAAHIKYWGEQFDIWVYNLQHPLNKKADAVAPTKKIRDYVGEAFSAAYSAATTPYSILDFSTPEYSGLSFDTFTSPYGGNTTVNRVPDIYIYQTFNGHIVGSGGMEEFGEFTARSISDYYNVGGNIIFLDEAFEKRGL